MVCRSYCIKYKLYISCASNGNPVTLVYVCVFAVSVSSAVANVIPLAVCPNVSSWSRFVGSTLVYLLVDTTNVRLLSGKSAGKHQRFKTSRATAILRHLVEFKCRDSR